MSEEDDKLSKLYHKASGELPGSDLDAVIKNAAYQALEHNRYRPKNRMWPLASVATLVLGVGLLVQLTPEVLHEPMPEYVLEQPLPLESQRLAPASLVAPAMEAESIVPDSPREIEKKHSFKQIKRQQEQRSEVEQRKAIIEKSRQQQRSKAERLKQDSLKHKAAPRMLQKSAPMAMPRGLPMFDAPAPMTESMVEPASLQEWLSRLKDQPKTRWLEAIAYLQEQGNDSLADRLEASMSKHFDRI